MGAPAPPRLRPTIFHRCWKDPHPVASLHKRRDRPVLFGLAKGMPSRSTIARCSTLATAAAKPIARSCSKTHQPRQSYRQDIVQSTEFADPKIRKAQHSLCHTARHETMWHPLIGNSPRHRTALSEPRGRHRRWRYLDRASPSANIL